MEVGAAGIEQGPCQIGEIVAPPPLAGNASPNRLDQVFGRVGAGGDDLSTAGTVQPRAGGGQARHLINGIPQETQRIVDKGSIDFGLHGGLSLSPGPRPGAGDNAPLADNRVSDPAERTRLATQPFGR